MASSCSDFHLGLKPAHFVWSLRVSIAQCRAVLPIWRICRSLGPSLQPCKQWYFPGCSAVFRLISHVIQSFFLPSVPALWGMFGEIYVVFHRCAHIHPMFLYVSCATHRSAQCPEPGKVPGQVPGELQGQTAFHHACQVCGPLPGRGNLRKCAAAHSSASPFPSRPCTYPGPVPCSHLGWESCMTASAGLCSSVPSFSFAVSQFSAPYLSGGSRQVITALQVSATCKTAKPITQAEGTGFNIK